MGKSPSIREGDIVGIPLGEGMVAAGIVLHVSTRIKNGILMGFYDQLFDSIETINVEALGKKFIATPNYTGKQLLTSRHWKVVGHSPRLLKEANIPELRAAYTLYRKDEVVRQLVSNELKDYPELRVEGAGMIEDKLREHFGKG